MTTANTTAFTRGVLDEPLMSWGKAEWLEAFTEGPRDVYPRSLIAASNDRCLLPLEDLQRLLQMHGTSIDELEAVLADCRRQDAPAQPLAHIGQALIWLGY